MQCTGRTAHVDRRVAGAWVPETATAPLRPPPDRQKWSVPDLSNGCQTCVRNMRSEFMQQHVCGTNTRRKCGGIAVSRGWVVGGLSMSSRSSVGVLSGLRRARVALWAVGRSRGCSSASTVDVESGAPLRRPERLQLRAPRARQARHGVALDAANGAPNAYSDVSNERPLHDFRAEAPARREVPLSDWTRDRTSVDL